MLTIPLIIVFGIGGIAFHRSFYALARTFLSTGIPDVWNDNVANSDYWRAFQYAIKIGVLLPIAGTLLALWVARSDTDLARTVVIIAFLPSAAIFGAILVSASVLAAIGTALFVPGEENREAVAETRRGISMEASGYLMWELMVGLFLYEIGIDATIKAIVVSVWGLILYGLAAYRYGWRVTWTPYVATWLGLGTCIVVATILTVMLLYPQSRQYAASVGIDPGRVLHEGAVVDTSDFIKAKEMVRAKMSDLCAQKALADTATAIAEAKTIAEVNAINKKIEQAQKDCR